MKEKQKWILAAEKKIKKIKSDDIRKKAFEELAKLKKRAVEIENNMKSFEKDRADAVADIVEGGLLMEDGKYRGELPKVVNVDEKYLNRFKKIYEKVDFWTLSSIEIIKNDKLRINAVSYLEKISEHSKWLIDKCKGRDWYKKGQGEKDILKGADSDAPGEKYIGRNEKHGKQKHRNNSRK